MRTKVQWKSNIKCVFKANPHSIKRSYEDRDNHNVCLLVCARQLTNGNWTWMEDRELPDTHSSGDMEDEEAAFYSQVETPVEE